MGPKADKKTLFKVIRAIDRAKFYDNYNKKSGAVRIDSRIAKEMNFLTKYEFGRGLKELEKMDAVEIEGFAKAENEHEQRHFQIKPTAKFKALFKKSAKFLYEAMLQTSTPNREFFCSGLGFNPSNGKYHYGQAKEAFRVGTQPWSVLYRFMTKKNQDITRDELKESIFEGWRTKVGKRQGKSEQGIALERIIGKIRSALKMTERGPNKNLIIGGNDGKTYKMICK